jgi:hypothetical protein
VARLTLQALLNTYRTAITKKRPSWSLPLVLQAGGGTFGLIQAEAEYGRFRTSSPTSEDADDAQMRIL